MRIVAVVVALVVGLGAIAHANDKALKPYAGKLVIAPDKPPSTLDELPAYLKIYTAKDNHYELIKGSPWKLHLVGVLASPAKEVTVVVVDKADKKATPLLSVGLVLSAHRKVLIAEAALTSAAGFEANKTYIVRVVLGKKVLATSEVLLRD